MLNSLRVHWMNRQIRVRYSGLINFMCNILSAFFGFIFGVLIARNLTMEELGAWFFLGGVISYFEIAEEIIPYWAKRDAARGREIVRTSILSNLMISIPPTIIFLSFSALFTSIMNISHLVFIIGGLMIPIYYLSTSEMAVISALFPEKTGIRVLIIDTIKIPLSLLLLRYGLVGVLIAVAAAYLAFIAYGWLTLKRQMESGIRLDWLKSRLKSAWIPLQHYIAAYGMQASDSVVTGLLTSPTNLSSYGVALTISRTFKLTHGLTSATYPKLLAEKAATERELASVFKFHYMFTIPMLIGGLILAPNLITIFGSRYLEGLPSLMILLLSGFVAILALVLMNLVRGFERVDEDVEVAAHKLLRSRLFAAEASQYLSLAVIVLGSFILIPLLGVVGAAIARLTSSIISLIFALILCRGFMPLKVVRAGILKPILASIPMALFLYFLKPIGSIQTLLSIFVGAIVYFLILYIIDPETRILGKIALAEVTQKLFPSED